MRRPPRPRPSGRRRRRRRAWLAGLEPRAGRPSRSTADAADGRTGVKRRRHAGGRPRVWRYQSPGSCGACPGAASKAEKPMQFGSGPWLVTYHRQCQSRWRSPARSAASSPACELTTHLERVAIDVDLARAAAHHTARDEGARIRGGLPCRGGSNDTGPGCPTRCSSLGHGGRFPASWRSWRGQRRVSAQPRDGRRNHRPKRRWHAVSAA